MDGAGVDSLIRIQGLHGILDGMPISASHGVRDHEPRDPGGRRRPDASEACTGMETLSHAVATRREAAARRHLLLVEDNVADAELEATRLTEGGVPFEISHVCTVGEAVQVLAKREVDAVILDLTLPDSHGVETVQRVRIGLRGAPIIVVTGHVDDELRQRAIAAGGDEVYSKDESNSRLFWRSVLQIIERKKAQQQQMRRLLDAMPDAVMVVNLDGIVRYVNRAATGLLGRAEDALLGASLSFSVGDVEPGEVTIARDGDERICEIRVVTLNWNDEQARLAVVRDLTESRQAEALRQHASELEAENLRIAASSRAKSAFLANMSHELRTPLNAIIGFSQLIQDGTVDPQSPQLQSFVGHILSSGKHLLELINDVLDLAKIEAGRLEFKPVLVDLAALTGEVVEVLGAISRVKNIEIQTSVDPAIGEACLDASRFKQVLYNYLSNAIKFTPAGGQITVQLSALAGDLLRLDVTDSGIGIAATDLPMLFTEFGQIEARIALRQQGTGLGLALTKQLVEAQGGSVEVASRPGRGSTFSAVLPMRPLPLVTNDGARA